MRVMSFIVCASVLVVCSAGAEAQVLPTGFTNDQLVAGLSEPVGMAWLPDGRLLVCEQRTAQIKVWTGGATMTSIGTVPNVRSTGNEQGLLSLAVDPGWPARPYVYVWYDTTVSANLRLAMFTVTGDLSNPASSNLTLGTQYVILSDFPDNASNHNGGALRFGIDGKLYLSMGDDASGCPAQNISSRVGAIWRIDVSSLPGVGPGPAAKSTLIPAGNPFAGPDDNARLCWAYGLRNPFRYQVDPVTGYLYIADVGQNTWEELDECTGGGQNFGWPWMEGNSSYTTCGGSQPPSVAPIVTWNPAGSAAIMSLGRYRNAVGGTMNFGAAYEGDVFYLEYYNGQIRRLQWNGSSWVTPAAVPGQPNATDWATGFQNVADALRGPDGALYYVRQFNPAFGPGRLDRIRSLNPNAPQMAIVSGNNQPGNAGRPLENPLVVRMTTLGGAPIAGATVNFAVQGAGGGVVTPPSATTDSQGYAQATLTMPASYGGISPIVAASSAGVPNVTFNTVWRGIVVSHIPGFVLQITVRHSQTNSPVCLAAETPPPAGPYVFTSWGDVWTSVLAPNAGFTAQDGLGLIGPPNPFVKTGPSTPTYAVTMQPPPQLGGVPFILQAYAIDTAQLPSNAAYMISNTATVTL